RGNQNTSWPFILSSAQVLQSCPLIRIANGVVWDCQSGIGLYDMGCHIDGFIAVLAHTYVLLQGGLVTRRTADSILAANTVAKVALRLVKPENMNYEVTETIQKVATTYECIMVENVVCVWAWNLWSVVFPSESEKMIAPMTVKANKLEISKEQLKCRLREERSAGPAAKMMQVKMQEHMYVRLEEYNSHPQKTIHNFKMNLLKQKLQLQTATQIMLAHFCFAAAADSVLGRIRAKARVDEQVTPKCGADQVNEETTSDYKCIDFSMAQLAKEDGEKKEDSMDTELPVIEKWLHYLIYIIKEDARILILLHAYHDSTTSLLTPLIMIMVSTRSSGVFWKLVSRKGL
ncbi:ERBB-3 binding protein 1 isoform X1, partial [Tanacetum coccineum]